MSYINDTLNALAAAAEASVALTGVTIYNGPKPSGESDFDRLFIGTDLDVTSQLAIEGQIDPSGSSGFVTVERFTILCVAEAWGGTDVNALRIRVFNYRDAVRELLRPTVAGVFLTVNALSSVNLGAWSLFQTLTSKGPYVGMSLRVECIAKPTT